MCEITSLFNAVVPELARSVAYWQWSNQTSPCGRSLSAVTKCNGKIVAHYSVMPVDFYIDGKPVVLGFGQQAVVHKDFRNLKIITDLMGFIFGDIHKKFPYVYAFPNDNFFCVKKRLLGWRETEVFLADVMRVKDIHVTGTAIEVKPMDSFPGLDWLNKNIKGNGLRRSAAFLNWRFFQHPINHYTVLGAYDSGACVGYLVLKLYGRQEDNALIGHLVDFDATNKDIAILKSLLTEAKNFFEFYGVEEIVFWNKDLGFKEFFHGLISGQGFKTNMCVFAGKNGPGSAITKESWSLTMAASDAF